MKTTFFPLESKGRLGNDSVFSNDEKSGLSGVVLCGSGAVRLYDCGTGSAGITTDKSSSIYEGLIQNGVEVSIGIPVAGKRNEMTTCICVARIAGMEGNDRKDMKLAAEDIQVLNQMMDLKRENPLVKLGLILNVSGPVDLTLWEKELDGIFCMFLPGMEGGTCHGRYPDGTRQSVRKAAADISEKISGYADLFEFSGRWLSGELWRGNLCRLSVLR